MQHILACHDIVKTDFVRGENCSLYDSRGRRYIDFESGIWCTVLGHSHPRINRAIREQVAKVMHLGTRYPNALAEEAALDVLDVTGLRGGKCIFLSSGSEAVEFGVLIARRVTGRRLLLAFSSSYLGAYGSAGGKRADEWQLMNWSARGRSAPDDCLQGIPFARIGAFVFEPGGSGTGFVRFPPKELVEETARRVREAGGLIVANEVTTGMGRTGAWFGFQHYNIHPDIIALGKGLGNGYPVSAVAMTRGLAEQLETGGFRYAQSHQNDPLGCAVARQVIAVLREEGWIERGRAIGGDLLNKLKQLAEKRTAVKEARGRGLLLGLELHPEHLSAESAYGMLLEKGFLVGYYPAGNVLRFDPALTIDEPDIARLLVALDTTLTGARTGAA